MLAQQKRATACWIAFSGDELIPSAPPPPASTVQDPAALQDLMAMQRDPEVMREVEALMDDPEFQQVRAWIFSGGALAASLRPSPLSSPS